MMDRRNFCGRSLADEKVSLSRAGLGKKASPSKEATGRSETCNKPITKTKLRKKLPLTKGFFLGLAEKGSGPSQPLSPEETSSQPR